MPEEAQEGHPDLVAGIDDPRALFEPPPTDVEAAEGTETFGAVTALASEGAVIGTEIDQAISQQQRRASERARANELLP